MAEAPQRPQPLTGAQPVDQGSIAASERPAPMIVQADSTSEGDAGEGRVREKLKQTSIDSKILVNSVETIRHAPDSTASTVALGVDETPSRAPPPYDDASDKGPRPLRKRSLEDLDTTEVNEAPIDEAATSPAGHARKRSKDVRNGDLTRPTERHHTPGALMEEDEEPEPLEALPSSEASEPSMRATQSIEADEPPEAPADTRIKETISPRRKRSREELDAEPDREQKIPTTDVSRARRRSSEEERRVDVDTAGLTSNEDDEGGHTQAEAPKEARGEDTPTSTAKIPPYGGLTNTSSESPFASLAKASHSTTPAPSKEGITSPQTSASAFAASGFAALASSAVSPFSAFGASPGTGRPSAPQAPITSVFGTTAATRDVAPHLGFGSTGPSPFVAAGAAPSVFSSAPSLGGFGTGMMFGTGSQSPGFTGPSSILGSTKPKPFGAPEGDEDDDDGSENEDGGGEASDERDEESSKSQKFDHDTGEEDEDTIFVNRGKLFAFKDRRWVERGIGPFKLNVKRAPLDFDEVEAHSHRERATAATPAPALEEADVEAQDAHPATATPTITTTAATTHDKTTRARFIMRSIATHRVILNAPLFKQMKFGDAEGKAPTSKVIDFSVVDDGRLCPYRLRMSKEDEVQRLCVEVYRLQETM